MKSKEDTQESVFTVMANPKTAFKSDLDYKIGRIGGGMFRSTDKDKAIRLFFLPKSICRKAALINLFYSHIVAKEPIPPLNRKIEHGSDWLSLSLHNWYTSVLPATKNSFVLLGTKFLSPYPALGIGRSLKTYAAKEEVKNEYELYEYFYLKYKADFENLDNIMPFHLVMDDITNGWLNKTILRFKDTYKEENCHRNVLMSIIIGFFFEMLISCGPDNEWFYHYYTNDKNKSEPCSDKKPPNLWLDSREKLLLEHKFGKFGLSGKNHETKHLGTNSTATATYTPIPPKPKRRKKLKFYESKIDKHWGSNALKFHEINFWLFEQLRIAQEELENRYNFYD